MWGAFQSFIILHFLSDVWHVRSDISHGLFLIIRLRIEKLRDINNVIEGNRS